MDRFEPLRFDGRDEIVDHPDNLHALAAHRRDRLGVSGEDPGGSNRQQGVAGGRECQDMRAGLSLGTACS